MLWACSLNCEISPAPIFTTSGRFPGSVLLRVRPDVNEWHKAVCMKVEVFRGGVLLLWWTGQREFVLQYGKNKTKQLFFPVFGCLFQVRCTTVQYPIHPALFSLTCPSVSQGPVSWQAQSCPALGFFNGLTPCPPCKQRPHFINLSPHGNSFPA